MKIGIITDAIDNGPISLGNYTENLIKGLTKIKGESLELTLIHGEKNNDEIYKNTREIIIPYVKVKKAKYLPLKILLAILNQLKDFNRSYKIKKFCEEENIDLLHIPNVGRNAPSLAFLFANFKLVVTNHGIANRLLPPELCWRKNGKILHVIYYIEYLKWKFLFRNKIDMLISVSKLAKKVFIEKLEFNTKKVTFIYHGVDHNLFRKIPNRKEISEEVAKKYKINSPFILHLSSYEPRKNVKNTIRAFSFLKKKKKIKEKLVLIGSGFDLLKPLIKKEGLENEILLLGHVPLKDLPKFYNLATTFVFPSYYESFGLPIIEAMACGCPVITSNVTACPEVAGNSAILVNPYSTKELAEAIYKVVSDKKLRKELKERGLKRAKEFTWEKCAREHLSTYKKVIKKKNF